MFENRPITPMLLEQYSVQFKVNSIVFNTFKEYDMAIIVNDNKLK